MIHADHMRRLFIVALTLTILSGMMVFGQIQTVQAAERGHRGEHFDSRHGHNRYYPSRGSYVRGLPRGYRGFFYHGSRYYFAGGIWYRPYGGRFLIVAPPFGLFIPFLPPFYETIWLGGVPYYYANDVYYAQAPGGYEVVDPPQDIVNEPQIVNEPLQSGRHRTLAMDHHQRKNYSFIPARGRLKNRRRMTVMNVTGGPQIRPIMIRHSRLPI